MEDSTRFRLQQARADEPTDVSKQDAPRASQPFVGDAMRALFDSGDVRIARGDETRVISNAPDATWEATALERELRASQVPPVRTPAALHASERARPGVGAADIAVDARAALPAADIPPHTKHSSSPPGPRVDVTLWAVLALGLFAIAGWMIVYAL